MPSSTENRTITLEVTEKDATSGILSLPRTGQKETALIVAHGAANNMTNPLMAAFAEGLAAEGYPVVRFNFLYAERGRRSPDGESLLKAAWISAYRYLSEQSGLAPGRIVLAGKSLGGRIASRMVAEKELEAEALIFLGYPLHRPGDASVLQDGHLYRIGIPMLFIEGTRDTLCKLDALEGVRLRLNAPNDLIIVEGGDHSFHVPRSADIEPAKIHAYIVGKTVEWLSRIKDGR